VGAGHGLHQPVAQLAHRPRTVDEQELSGTANSQFLSRIDQIITGQPRGSNVLLTLDPAIQKAAFDALGTIRAPSSRSSPRPGASSRW
jgi:cell division protein FtsI/penicillin-binding protein 2